MLFLLFQLGFTPLHYAAKFNYPDILKLCVSVNVRCKLNRTPLHLAAYYGHVECVKVLLSKNASVDSMDTVCVNFFIYILFYVLYILV